MDLVGTPIARLFWEYAPGQVSSLPDDLVFVRVMERGTLADYRWLLHTCALPTLQAWFRVHAARQLNSRTLALWSCLLELPRPVPTTLPWQA